MHMIQYTTRAVAFIDVIGFTPLVERSTQNPADLIELNDLVSLLGGVIPYLDRGVAKTVPPDRIPRHTYISDCIILSAPVDTTGPSHEEYSGLDVVVMRVIQVAQFLLANGYLLRGGIDVGPAWHADGNIVGPAYQCAYALEGTASFPRVILSDRASTLWRESSQRWGNQMCIDHDGRLMVHTLHSHYVPSQFGGDISAAHRHYLGVIHDNLGKPLAEKNLAKWRWFEEYLQQRTP